MRAIRVHLPLPLQAGAQVELPEDAAHHLCKVLRLRSGDILQVFNARDGEFQATVLDTHGKTASITCGKALDALPEPALQLTLVQALATGDRVDTAIQKATELGACTIKLFGAARSQGKLTGARQDKKLAHWQRVAVAASEQCGRCFVPPVEFMGDGLPAPTAELALLLDPLADGKLAALPAPETIERAIGPAGGFSEAELARAESQGWQAIRCGPRVLRTETAGPAVLAALQALYGDWQ